MFLKYVYLVLLCLVLKLNIAQVYFNNRYDNYNSCDLGLNVLNHNGYYINTGITCNGISFYALNLTKVNLDGTVNLSKTYYRGANNFSPNLGRNIIMPNNDFIIGGARFYKTDTSLVFLWRFNSNLDSVKYTEYGYLNKKNQINSVLKNDIYIYMVGFVDSLYKNSDILLIKTDTSGNEIWKKKIGLPNYDETAWCIKTSSDGKLLISGNRRLHNNQATNGAFVLKADTNGTIIWEKYFPSNYGLAATGMVELPNGDIVAIAGKGFGSTISRYELIKLDAAGNIIFDKVYGPMADRAEAYSLIQNQEGNLVAAGQIYYSINNSVNGLVYVFNQNGDSLFSREYSVQPYSQNYFRDLVQAPDKGYVFSGFISPIFANGGTGNQDIWLLKTDSTFCEGAFNCGYPTAIQEAEILEAGEMSVYPNPANGLVTITSKYNFDKIALVSVTGQVLLKANVNNKTHQLQLQNLAEGIYFVNVSYSNGMSAIKKVVVNH